MAGYGAGAGAARCGSADPLTGTLCLDEEHQRLGQDAVIGHRLAHRRVLHRGHEPIHVRYIHEHRDLRGLLRVDEGPDVGDAERPEDLLALRGSQPMLRVLDVVMSDDGRHGITSERADRWQYRTRAGSMRPRSSLDRPL